MLQQMNGGTRGHSMQDESGIKMQKREMAEKDENLEGKRRLALEVIERLRQAYPDADCTLDYDDAWKLLVSVRLAAQCTDARVNVVVKDLYAKYPSPEALAKASPEEIEEIVRPCGLGRSKARDISGCMRMLVTEYGGRVPDTMEELLRLPGVGRKSANLVLGDTAFGYPTGSDLSTIRRIRSAWRWRSGKSSLRRKGISSATGLCFTEERSARRVPAHFADDAACLISAEVHLHSRYRLQSAESIAASRLRAGKDSADRLPFPDETFN